MTNEEQIKFHLQGATDATGCTRQHVNAIKELLQPEPESLVGFHICNELGRENALLRNELTDMTLNYNAAEKHARQLKQELIVTIRSNTWLRERLTFKDESLRACRAAEKVPKAEVARQNELLEEAERRVKSLRATCSKVMADAGVMELRASNVMLLRRNKWLKREFDLQERYIEILKNDRRQALEQNKP